MKPLTLRLDAYQKEAKQLVADAQRLADDRGHAEVEPIHLWYLLVDRVESAQRAIEEAGIAPTDVLVESEWALRKLKRRADGRVEAYLSPKLLDVLARAEGEAARGGGTPISVRELLVACAQDASESIADVLKASGLSAPVLRATLTQTELGPDHANKTGSTPLEEYGRDLTRLAAEDVFDPTVGRDAELRRIVQVLARRKENNALLVGEPGTGKIAIVESLAMRIAKGDVPTMLEQKRIIALEMGVVVAGAKLRGQLEERIRLVLDAVRDSAGQVILFIPDLAMLLHAKGGAEGLLTAALSKGEVQIVAVCTPDVLREISDRNSALLRRFVPIHIDPPTVDEAIAILRGVVGRFEAAHGVRITDPALIAAVNFARRYVPRVQLPKSAIDLIDESAARVRVEMQSVPAELDALERRLQALEIQRASLDDDRDAGSVATRASLQSEADALVPQIETMREAWQRRIASHNTVTEEDIAKVVALWTGIPVARMLEEEATKLLEMEDRLEARVVGQDHAVSALSKAVRRGRTGLRDPKRPVGSFLFLGPTGVGKTELAKALAEFLFDDEHSLTRLDMSEFMEKHMVARLLGAPPGYVDSEAGGFLTEAVRRRPYSVVLFDEIEKAHPDVFNILLQVLDDGRLSDSRGRIAHFSDTVIIMTSNIGGAEILRYAGDADELRDTLEQELHNHFRPEFLNRIDEVLIFNTLDRKSLRKIVDLQLNQLAELLDARQLALRVTDAAKEQLVQLGYQPAFGARPLQRVIVKRIQDPLAESLLSGEFSANDTVHIDYRGGEFMFERADSSDS